jgi:hypothetical protein
VVCRDRTAPRRFPGITNNENARLCARSIAGWTPLAERSAAVPRRRVRKHELVGLPDDTPLWRYQPDMRYHVVDEGAFSEDDLAARDTLAALLFRLEALPDPERVVVLADAVLAWFVRHPGFEGLRSQFAELLGGLMGPLAPGVRVPEELLEVRNMLASRAEDWKRQWLQEGCSEGRVEGRLEGEAALLLRQLERRFGALPAGVKERVAIADAVALETWGLRVLDAGSLDDVLR